MNRRTVSAYRKELKAECAKFRPILCLDVYGCYVEKALCRVGRCALVYPQRPGPSIRSRK